MKKILLKGVSTLLSVAMCGQAFIATPAGAVSAETDIVVSITEQAFPDAKFRQWLMNSAHINGYGADGVLTQKELSSITQINVSGQGIRSLEGIAHFSALEQLDCKNNALKELDVQQNRMLKGLHCAFNTIASLDVSGLDRLIALNCESNQMTSLNLTDCTALETIYCRNNNLPKVDFSTNTALKFIETFDNKLTNVDLSMLKDLEFVHLDHNLLKHLDLSGNTKLSPVGSGFVARNNQLDTLTLPVKESLLVDASVYAEQDPKIGYERTEWYLDQEFKQPAPQIIAANGQTLYVKWLPNDYTIYFSSNGGRGSMASVSAVWDTSVELPKNLFSRVGYQFAGWENTYGDSGQYADGQMVTNLAGEIQGDRVTLYAQWKPITYMVAFDPNGGSGSMQSQEFTYDQAKALQTNTLTAPTGKEFAGWARKSDGPVLYSDSASVRNLTATQDETITLYAIWREPIVNDYINKLNSAFFAYRSEEYTEEDWNNLAEIYDTCLQSLSQIKEETQMKSLLAEAQAAMADVADCNARVKQAIAAWRAEHQTVIAQASGNAVNEANASDILRSAQIAAVALTSEFVASHTKLNMPADQERVASLALLQIDSTVQALNQLAEAAAWTATLEGLSTQSLSDVTSQWQAQYETACQQAVNYQKHLSTELVGALQMRAALSLRKQQAVSQLRMDYSSLDPEKYTEAGLSQLENIFETGLVDIEAAVDETAVNDLLTKAQAAMQAVPDKNEPTEPEGGGGSTEGGESGDTGGGSSGGGASGGAGGGSVTEKPENNKNASTVDVSVTYDATKKTAQAAPTASALQQAAEAAKKAASTEGTAPIVEVVMNSGAAKNVELMLPSGALDGLASDADALLSVQSSLGAVTLDARAMRAVTKQAGSRPFVLSIMSLDAPVSRAAKNSFVPMFAVAISADGKPITNLSGGSIAVTVPYALSADQRAECVVSYAENTEGSWEKCSTSYDLKTQTVTLVLTAPARIAVEVDETLAWKGTFTDVRESDWYYDAVRYVCYYGIMNGHSVNAFRPDENLSRAQLAQVLYNMEGRPHTNHVAYSDVISGAWYEDAINWAVSCGILTGYGSGRIGPDDAVTREQFAAMLYRYAETKGYPTNNRNDLSDFSDADSISAYARIPMQWAVDSGIISGTSADILSPAGNALRAQAAAMLMRFSNSVAS